MDSSWLKRRVTVVEAEAIIWGGRVPDRPPVPPGHASDPWQALLEEVRAGDELWEYDSPRAEWDRHMGSYGVALVRGGEVVATYVYRMN